LINTLSGTNWKGKIEVYAATRLLDLRFVKVFAFLNRSVASVVIEPLKNSRPNL
jgi:hypothetical protein